MTAGRTIVAVASARGPAARSIVRLSGPAALAAVQSIFVAAKPVQAAGLYEGELHFDSLSVPCTLWLRLAPRSATGEDCAELHVPGSALLVATLLRQLLEQNVELAQPGEFTRRAFSNGKLDLSQAEAVAMLTAAEGEAERCAAMAMLAGGLGQRLLALESAVHHVLIPLELGFDFSDQDVAIPLPEDAVARLEQAAQQIEALAAQGTVATAGAARRLVLLRGPANAGKSTLFNALLGHSRALVSAEVGTTRDPVHADLDCAGSAITLVDTAGDDVGESVADLAAHAARRRLESTADLFLEVRRPGQTAALLTARSLRVWTHADLLAGGEGLHVSGSSGTGLAELRAAIRDALEHGDARVGLLNVRQAEACAQVAVALRTAAAGLVTQAAGELVAADLHAALAASGTLSGRDAPTALLDRIFSGFCIGK